MDHTCANPRACTHIGAGGADYGLAQAIDEGVVSGPKVLFSGHALSQTGGHGDMRHKVRGGGQHRL
jgi:imidazolonepropionase-like amidohydrolase